MNRVLCSQCQGKGHVPWKGEGPWAGKTTKTCGTCLGKGWNRPGAEITVGRSGYG